MVRANRLFVGETIDGQPTALLIDSGAWATILTPGAVARLKLSRSTRFGSAVVSNVGVGGQRPTTIVSVRELRLGRLRSTGQQMLAGDVLPAFANTRINGLLSNSLLAGFDLDLDTKRGAADLTLSTGSCRHPSVRMSGDVGNDPA